MSIGHETTQGFNEEPHEDGMLPLDFGNPAPAHSGIIPVEEGGERPPEDAVPLTQGMDPATVEVPTDVASLTETKPAPTKEAPRKSHRNAFIASGVLGGLLVTGVGIGAALSGGGKSEKTGTKPVATSTQKPSGTTAPAPVATNTPAPNKTSATSVPASGESVPAAEQGITPHITSTEFASKVDATRVGELLTQYPDLADYLQLPPRAIAAASDKAIARERNLVREVFSSSDGEAFLVNPNDPNDPDFEPWFSASDIANTTAADSNAGIPIVEFPDFSLRWATFFTTPGFTDKMINMAYANPADADKYEQSIAGQGQVGHAKAVRSDVIGAVQGSDHKLYIGTVTEYEPGNGEATGRVDVRWSLILPMNDLIKRAPANADYGIIVAQKYLGNAPGN